MNDVEIIVLLLFAITFLALLSNRYKYPFAVVLVLAGLLISLIPGLPGIMLKPEIVFFVFLPPLLYAAAWNTSWRDFKANLRPISLAAIGLVFFTTTCVAILVHYMIPEFTWAQSFLLGAIVSPPDAVAATSITRGLGIHPRIIAILDGESLVNDASALVGYKYALGAILAGSFSLGSASLNFILVFCGGVAVGIALGFCIYWLHTKWIKDAVLDVTITFLTPFAAYLLAEKMHVSGVLAVVSSGLYLAFRSAEIFSHQSRIQAYAVWEVVIFILTALVFILLGLQLKVIIRDFDQGELFQLILYGIIISMVCLIVRLIWIVPAATIPRLLSRRIRETEYFDKRNIIVFVWAGMRGIVSMAAALAIPLTLHGSKFPNRSEIIFLTFCVILFTLTLQGVTLPWVINALKLPKYSILIEEYDVRSKLIEKTKNHIETNLSHISEEIRDMLWKNYDTRYNMLQHSRLPEKKSGKKDNPATRIFNQFGELQLELLKLEREMANQLRKKGNASEEVIRKIEREIDLEEARLRMELYND
jgi:monovalent cation/hydrogen antiporter